MAEQDYSDGVAMMPITIGLVVMGLPFASSWAMFQVSFGESVLITIIAAISWAVATAFVQEKLPWLSRWHTGTLVIGWCISLYYYLYVHPYPPVSAGKLPLGLMAPLAAFVTLGFYAWVVPTVWGVLVINWRGEVWRGEITIEQAAESRANIINKLTGGQVRESSSPPPSGDEFEDMDTADGGGFEYDPSSFEGSGNDNDDKLWRMAEDPRTPEAERNNAMRVLKKRNKKRITQ